jgi:predicted pyridoxine 5'-phosphate oxidase superfamily flavin-nucleotide-binding protein
MGRAFTELTFTPSVRAAQQQMGSRRMNQAFEQAADPRDRLGPDERAFIEERDSFFQATVGSNGWPYVQHRGGPPGFLRALDETTIAYADMAGNRQYLSFGNLSADGRVSLILMSYPTQERLKIWGEARIGTREEAIAAGLPGDPARIERAVLIRVLAYEWNCSRYIPQRYTADEWRELLDPLEGDNHETL